MKWTVRVHKKAAKQIKKLPERVKAVWEVLRADLEVKGPAPGKAWKNYSKLSETKHHCHLKYSWVACWEVLDDEIRLMEVYYVGSREDAPY